MMTHRWTSRLVRRWGWLGLSLLVMLWFAACRPGSRSPAGMTSVPTAAVTATATTTAAATTTATAATEGWLTYIHTPTGYSVEYPVGWTVNEQAKELTTFTSPDGRASIMVSVQPAPPGQTEPPEPSDLPNTRCQQVKIGPALGTRCFDTLSFSTSTTLWHEGMIYTITAISKGMERDIYDHLVNSFRPLARGAS